MNKLVFALLCLLTSASSAFAWGSLMVSDDGEYFGFAVGQRGEAAAIQAARAKCGVYCSPTFTFAKTCAAFARDPSTYQWGWSKGATTTVAQDLALGECRKQGASACKVLASGCD